jgi:hypothetical protein
MVAIFPASSKEGGVGLGFPDACWVPSHPVPEPMPSNQYPSSSKTSYSKMKNHNKTEPKTKGSSAIPKKSMTAGFQRLEESSSMIGGGIQAQRSSPTVNDDDFWSPSALSGIKGAFGAASHDDDSGIDSEWLNDPFNRDSSMQFLILQQNMQNESRRYQTISTACRARHDIAMSSVRNMRA